MADRFNMSLEQIAKRLGGEVSGGQVIAPGPNHSAEDRSLTVKPAKTAGLFVFCHADDDIRECKDYVRAKLGAPPWEPSKSNGKSRIAKTYDYVDEHGALLFQVVRFEPKDFRQRKPDGNGSWTWKLGDTPRVLYHLPEMIEAIASEHPIFIAEGEKDVDALVGIGVTATCNPGGAGKWRDEYSQISPAPMW